MSRKKMVSIKVDADTYHKAVSVLESRGTNLETWIKLQLRAFSKSGKSMLGLKDKMQSGKYTGELVEDVVRTDVRYAAWMLAQNFATKYDVDVYELVEELNAGL